MLLILSRPAFLAHARALRNAIPASIRPKESLVDEAVARGFGFNTVAALAAKLNESPDGKVQSSFDKLPFYLRLMELDERNGEAAIAALEGIRAEVLVQAYQPEHPRYREGISGNASVSISGVTPATWAKRQWFILPLFMGKEGEPYRIDCGHGYRITDMGEDDVRHPISKLPQCCEIKDGRWGGEFFLYSEGARKNPGVVIGSMEAALMRAILSTLNPLASVRIWKPSGAHYGAWRIQARLGSGAKSIMDRVSFSIPALPARSIVAKGNYFTAGEDNESRGVFVNGIWNAHVYTNGCPEDENETSIQAVKSALYREVFKVLFVDDMFSDIEVEALSLSSR